MENFEAMTPDKYPEYFLKLYEFVLRECDVEEISKEMGKNREIIQREIDTLENYIKNRKIPKEYKEKFAEVKASVLSEEWFEWKRERARDAGVEKEVQHLISKKAEEEFKERLIPIYKKYF